MASSLISRSKGSSLAASPEPLGWAVLQQRLTVIMEASPRNEYLQNPDPCIQRIIRLRDIADYCDLDKHEIHHARRGDRPLKPEVQKRLSWFFFNLDRGILVKEKQVDGKWRIVHTAQKVPADAPDAGPKAIKAQVDFATGRLKL